MDPLALILLVLCIVLVAAMWAALVAGEQVAERIRASGDDPAGARVRKFGA